MNFYKIKWFLLITTVISLSSLSILHAQMSQSIDTEDLQPLQAGSNIYNFTGNLSWYTFYKPSAGDLIEESQTELYIEFRNINILSPHVGFGYKFFSTVFMNGFFEGGGLGGVGAGPLLRYYLLEDNRWQPYLQGSLAGGYNLALSSGSGISDVKGLRFRSSLRAGLGYKFSNTFGLFFEIGPSWEYGQNFQLDSHALLINVGIELFQF